MERLRAAITLVKVLQIKVDGQEASAWVKQAGPAIGVATVVFHSVVWQYMPQGERAAVYAALLAHGRRATREAPFAWLRMELDEAARQFQLRLSLWPTGEERLLAIVHPHGEFARWC